MRSLFLFAVVLLSLIAQTTSARPLEEEVVPIPLSDPSPWVRFSPAPNKTAVDTTYILGGPDRWDGSFDSPDGQPDWHGWTQRDNTGTEVNRWHVSQYWAEHLEGHGAGNHAMYCGEEDIPACSAADTIGGYGDNYFEELTWRWPVADATQPSTLHLTGLLTYDLTDTDWDFLELFVKRNGSMEKLASWTGTDESTTNLDFTTIINPEDYQGPYSNEIFIWWRVWSDGAWSDYDCLSAGHGACQLDDLAVYVDSNLITFDDFEPGSTINWNTAPFPGIGDFTNLRNDLGDDAPCVANSTYQVNFVDDGVIVPGTGGTPCVNFCYDPGGWIVNNTGGLLAGDSTDWFIDNAVISPPVAWVPGNDGAELSFDVYVDERLHAASPGIFYRWEVRSTSSEDAADLENAPWVDRNFVHYGGPEYRRHNEHISDLIVTDCKWVQISLKVTEMGWLWGWNGLDGTPAPYFDNVALKIWPPEGPEILVKNGDLFSDSFPSMGSLNPDNLAANSCRLDIYKFGYNATSPGDSMAIKVTPLRQNSTIATNPQLHWAMQCNPVFNSVRDFAPDAQGNLQGMVESHPAYYNGSPRHGYWNVDLPDSNWFYPGDVLHYYITASDDLEGDIRTAVWPPDTSSLLDFTPNSTYPTQLTVRALPTVNQPMNGAWQTPPLLLVDHTGDSAVSKIWVDALVQNSYVQGTHFDLVKLEPQTYGLDGFADVDDLALYQTIIYTSGNENFNSMTQISEIVDDAVLFRQWLDLGNKRALFGGNNLWNNLNFIPDGLLLAQQFGVYPYSSDISNLNGGVRDLQVSPLLHNGVLADQLHWSVYGGCPDINTFDAMGVYGTGFVAATLDPVGSTNGQYAAVIASDDQAVGNRTLAFSFDLAQVDGGSARSLLMAQCLSWLGQEHTPAGDTPLITAVSANAYPNPFNPSTNIAFELPRAMKVSLDIYDIHGLLVRTLLDDSPYLTGQHNQVWDGRNSKGRNTASGVYFYKLRAGDEERVGKLTLLK